MQNPMNPFGASPFNGGIPPAQFVGPIPVQNLGPFANMGGFYNNGPMPLQPGNGFMMNNPFTQPPVINPLAPNYQVGPMPGPGFGVPQPAFVSPGYDDPNYFGSGAYGRPRSRHSSRHRSKSRSRRGSRSSSSEDDRRGGRGSPFAPGVPYMNAPVLPPRGGSPLLPPRPAW